MMLYDKLCRQEQHDISHQTPKKVLILVLTQWYSNWYMISEMDSKYNWWHVGSVLVSLMVYQKSRVCQALLYMQHRHMVCSEFHIWHDLVLDQNANHNAYSTTLIHEDLDVDHKMVIIGTSLFHNTFQILVCNISIIPNMIFYFYPLYFTGYFYIYFPDQPSNA